MKQPLILPRRCHLSGAVCYLALAMLWGFVGCTHPNNAKRNKAPKAAAKGQRSKTVATTDRDAPAKHLGPPPKLLSNDELDQGWIALFDGQTLFGWQSAGNAKWQVDADAHTITVDGKDAGVLFTTTQLGDCQLSLEYRCAPGTLGGILLAAEPTATDPTSRCHEIRIGDQDTQFPAGSLVGHQTAPSGREKKDQWNLLEVQLSAGTINAQLNHQTVAKYTDLSPLGRGCIGLRHAQGAIQFRNIKLRPLGLQSIFNGRDLTGWKTYPEMPSVFSVTKDGYLHVENGRGQLETEQSYGDFVLQLECITHAPNLNSGIFFRCIPGQQMNGYESQIHNGFKNGDRTQPVDCGTGGIFRRQNARRVVADDQKWFHKTIIATGPHVAVWVDGYQVTDWTDTRAPNENPRRGLRLEPGTIMIQGHDPTTNISFRNLRAAEIPKRAKAGRD